MRSHEFEWRKTGTGVKKELKEDKRLSQTLIPETRREHMGMTLKNFENASRWISFCVLR